MYLKIHHSGDRTVVALCDKNLIGKRIEDKKLRLDITERFYKGEERIESDIIEILKDATNLNIVGKKSIELALKSGVITKENIIKIKGIPHAQSTAL